MKHSFHLAFPIRDLAATKSFYCDLLGCSIGRSASNWIDINFFGNQITAHVNPDSVCLLPNYRSVSNPVPIYHFGAVLPMKYWNELLDRIRSRDYPILAGPMTVFEGEIGEQRTFFLEDPNGYPVEFKSFHDLNNLFQS